MTRFARAWKGLARILAIDLRVARNGGADLAQELHQANELLALLLCVSEVRHEETDRCVVTFWDDNCNEWEESGEDFVAVLRKVAPSRPRRPGAVWKGER